MNGRKVVTSAIIVSPPKDTWGPIQDIRLKFDKAYKRWMPHINLIYPFFPQSQFESVLPELKAGLAGVAPFTVRFETFDYFEHGASSCTLFLKPTVQPPNALRELQAALERVFPACNEQSTKSEDGFHAHLTVGQFRGKAMAERKKAELLRSWKPIEWRVDHVQLISRTSTDPFEVINTVPLGVAPTPARTAPSSVSASPARNQPAQPQPQTRAPRPSPTRQSSETGAHKTPPQPDETEGIVIERLKVWIARNSAGPKASLPKTKAKLRAAIKPMCSVKAQHLDVDEAVRQLQSEGHFSVDGAGKITFLKKKAAEESDRFSTNSFVARESYRMANETRKDPAKLALVRCREWVEAPLNKPTTLDALKNSLRQLCVSKDEVAPDDAVKLLEAHNVVFIDLDDKVTYADI
ncbi:Endonuclease/exonuclease/phosphatase family protein [Acanthamoeba castellanii str. Neff]|uniref:Endonuclease/exonuclease/phosphatase family protein n=1 Tax=Acanthamoeba castellanii (strain ATCC 30010 / Neff) TaxID=1257118 RepID=L8GPZ7_ACACF|nr:Endonuclease/exonuclease/phosphatase family protein [Acanthamoeba castellanii str. Neff]ELR14718.1 Endonuclease/exonuclease/phosphatase family protein [Acanthamoeba castellanii str. Neff]